MEDSENKKKKEDVVYMLRCCDGSYYTGWTNDIKKRLKAHSSGKGGKYTRSRLPVTLVYKEICKDQHEAMRREWEIKQYSREMKTELIHSIKNSLLQ